MNASDPKAYTIRDVDSMSTTMTTSLQLAPLGDKAVFLDFDDTEDPAHSDQEQIRYDGYYGGYCFLPLHLYEGLSGRLITTIFKANRLSGNQMLWEYGDIISISTEMGDIHDVGSRGRSRENWGWRKIYAASSSTRSHVIIREGQNMAAITEIARQFFVACETGKGWEYVKHIASRMRRFRLQRNAYSGIAIPRWQR